MKRITAISMVVCVMACLGCVSVRAKVFTEMELAYELRDVHNVPVELIPTFVCIAKHASSLNTRVASPVSQASNRAHGLFSIGSEVWCAETEKDGHKWCGVMCASLEDDDITDDVKCAVYIYNDRLRFAADGFEAWSVYSSHCKNEVTTKQPAVDDTPSSVPLITTAIATSGEGSAAAKPGQAKQSVLMLIMGKDHLSGVEPQNTVTGYIKFADGLAANASTIIGKHTIGLQNFFFYNLTANTINFHS